MKNWQDYWLIRNCNVVPSLLCIHMHLLSSDWKRHLWSSKCFSKASVCLCLPFIWRSLHFFDKSFLFLFLFLWHIQIVHYMIIVTFGLMEAFIMGLYLKSFRRTLHHWLVRTIPFLFLFLWFPYSVLSFLCGITHS